MAACLLESFQYVNGVAYGLKFEGCIAGAHEVALRPIQAQIAHVQHHPLRCVAGQHDLWARTCAGSVRVLGLTVSYVSDVSSEAAGRLRIISYWYCPSWVLCYI